MLGKSGTEWHYFGLRRGCVMKKKKELLLFLLSFLFFIVLYVFMATMLNNREKCKTQQVSSLKQKSRVESVKTHI